MPLPVSRGHPPLCWILRGCCLLQHLFLGLSCFSCGYALKGCPSYFGDQYRLTHLRKPTTVSIYFTAIGSPFSSSFSTPSYAPSHAEVETGCMLTLHMLQHVRCRVPAPVKIRRYLPQGGCDHYRNWVEDNAQGRALRYETLRYIFKNCWALES